MWNQKRELKSGKSLPHKIRKSQVKAWDFFYFNTGSIFILSLRLTLVVSHLIFLGS